MKNDVVFTEFGVVKISKKSLSWLNSIDKNWYEIFNNKRLRSKHAKYVREQVLKFESAVMIAAEIAYHTEEILEEF